MTSWRNCRPCVNETSSTMADVIVDSLVLIGRTSGMEDVVQLAQLNAGAVASFRTIPEALSIAAQSPLIIVLQHEPDEFSPEEISELLNAAPLSRLMVCQGAWCASFGRTRQCWPAAVCVDETRWLRRLKSEFTVLQGSTSPLPWTAGLDEIFAFDYGPKSVDDADDAPQEAD